jgi:hypothetical protein
MSELWRELAGLLAAVGCVQAFAHLSTLRSDMNTVIGLLGKVKKSCQYEIWGLK